MLGLLTTFAQLISLHLVRTIILQTYSTQRNITIKMTFTRYIIVKVNLAKTSSF